MDALTLFGLLAVTGMLVFYALEDRSPWFILAVAGGIVASLRSMASSKAPGLSAWSRRSGPGWRSGAGTARLQASIPVKPIFNANVAVR